MPDSVAAVLVVAELPGVGRLCHATCTCADSIPTLRAISNPRVLHPAPGVTLRETRFPSGYVMRVALAALTAAWREVRSGPHCPGTDRHGEASHLESAQVGGVSTSHVICGLSPLALAVAEKISQRDDGARIVVVPDERSSNDVADEFEEKGFKITGSGRRRAPALKAAGLEQAACLLALGEDPVENVRTAVAGWELNPDVKVIVATFDQTLAVRLEEDGLRLGRDKQRRAAHRAYSEAALAAPFFVARVLEATNLYTMRFGDKQIPVCCVDVVEGSPLVGQDPKAIRQKFRCQLVARRRRGRWSTTFEEHPAAQEGDALLVAGIQSGVLRLVFANGRSLKKARKRLRASAARIAGRVPRSAASGAGWLREGFRTRTAPVLILSVLTLSLVATVAVFASAGYSDNVIDASYFGIRTALGEQTFEPPEPKETELRLMGTVALLLGGALIAIIFGQVAAMATKSRLDPQSGAERLGQELKDHVVVAGLGELGYRLSRLLRSANIPCIFISPSADDPFVDAVQTHAPVLFGNIRLRENLERAGVRRALGLVACSEDNLANVEACMRAERMAAEVDHTIHTVARVFRDKWASQAAEGFGIDSSLAAADAAAATFADAATGSGWNYLPVAGLDLVAARCEASAHVAREDLADWGRRGVKVLAVRRRSEEAINITVELTVPKDGLREKDQYLLVGEREALQTLLADKTGHANPGCCCGAAAGGDAFT
jgi:Trk K+ transport system NAD-binding subunit